MVWELRRGAAAEHIHCTVELPMRLAQLTGSHAQGTLQLAESAINELLRLSASGAHKPTLTLLPRNRLLLRVGLFHAHAELPASMQTGPSPQLTLALASIVVAWGLKAVVKQPFVHFHGRHLTIDLAAIPGLHAWREVWRHIHQVTFETVPGALRIQFAVAVTDDDAGGGPATGEINARMD
jgi:hypothetical protein